MRSGHTPPLDTLLDKLRAASPRPETPAEQDLIRTLARLQAFTVAHPDATDEEFKSFLLGFLHSSVHADLLIALRRETPNQSRVGALVKLGLQRAREVETVVVQQAGQPDRSVQLPASLRPELAALSAKPVLTEAERARVREMLDEHAGAATPERDVPVTPRSLRLFDSFFAALGVGIDDGVHQAKNAIKTFSVPMYPLEIEGQFEISHFIGKLKDAGLMHTLGPALPMPPAAMLPVLSPENTAILHETSTVLTTDTAGTLWDLWEEVTP